MKKLLLASVIITIALASCSVTQPDEYYSPQQRVYTNPNYQYDPSYNPGYDNRNYTVRRVYDYNTGRYYDVAVYNSPYGTSVYPQQTYRRDSYRRDNYRRDNYRTTDNTRREYYSERQQQPSTEQRVEQPREKRLPDGTRISPDGTVTLPNGQVRRSQ
ncbi:MAG TPA: hypothetical protein VMY77_04265 [Chitinophagaceae bacterium]|nr:hypothetical protein [Chitinophagaceae bacterium]